MKPLCAWCVVSLFLIVLCEAQDNNGEEKQYTTKWDHIDVDHILSSERLLKNYANCLLDKGSCSPDATDLKRILPDALATDCKKCTENQKKGADKVIQYLIKQKNDLFRDLEVKYDPEMKYRARYPKSFE